ncbi:MAG: class I SAM-dependent methyltransferase [Gammaproteobacteria bacterium]|nr:class I SAM-dependent methyltransferase [Gammaproteobacteria bacterium]
MTNLKESKALLERAYSLKEGEAMSLYRDWADSYDADLVDSLGYVGPLHVAEIAATYCENKAARILDVGCGTGLVAQGLSKLGYDQIDGLDFSQEMLEVARTKGIYNSLINADLTKKLSIEKESYYMLVSCGTFTHSHVGPEAFDELIRVTRPSGILCISINAAIFESNGFEKKLSDLESSNQIKIESKDTIKLTVNEPVDGFVVVLKKL